MQCAIGLCVNLDQTKKRRLDMIEMVKQPDPFSAMRREIREETGVQLEDISAQYCLGAVYDVATPHGELCFLTQLHITLDEVRRREPEDREIKHLHSLVPLQCQHTHV